MAGCCECGDEPSGSCTTELVSRHLFELRIGFLDIVYMSFGL
jgi:hypothetical protein